VKLTEVLVVFAVFLDDSRENVKLGDFGLSKSMGSAAFANTYVGTPYYMSPELFNESAYDAKSDIWALGCVIYEMVALQYVSPHVSKAGSLKTERVGELMLVVSCLLSSRCSPPFHLAKTHNDLANQLRSQRIPPLPRKVSPALRDIIMRMLSFDPKGRPSALDLLSHPMMEVHKKMQDMHKSFVPQPSAQLYSLIFGRFELRLILRIYDLA
jgi:serine/threonine protein kinase